MNQKLFNLFIALGNLWICQPTWQAGWHWSLFCSQQSPGIGGVYSLCQEMREQVAQPSSAPVGHAGCASPGHAQTPRPHVSGLCWALLMPWQGTQDCKTNCCQNSVWNECVIVVIPTGSTGSTVCSSVSHQKPSQWVGTVCWAGDRHSSLHRGVPHHVW